MASRALAAPLRLLFLLSASSIFTVGALCTLMIYHQAFSLQHDVQPGTAKTLPLPCQLTHSAPQDIIITLLRPVPVDRG